MRVQVQELQNDTISARAPTQFAYSNGDRYVGDMLDGLPHGVGEMSYAAGGEVYRGQWRRGQHHGRGEKNWGDGILYCGEWQVRSDMSGEHAHCLLVCLFVRSCLLPVYSAHQDGMMHGEGRYVMADGTEVSGTFAEDEFVE